MGLYRCQDDSEYLRKPDKKEFEKYDHDKHEDCHDDCDSESARALKRILGLIDDLNNRDLHILHDVIERLLCSRHGKEYKD